MAIRIAWTAHSSHRWNLRKSGHSAIGSVPCPTCGSPVTIPEGLTGRHPLGRAYRLVWRTCPCGVTREAVGFPLQPH